MMRRMLLVVLFLSVLVLGIYGALRSGIYNVSALDPHWMLTSEVIELARDSSVAAHSRDTKVPPLDDPKLISGGMAQYNDTCRLCHGAPGVPADVIAQGMYPAPANLLSGDTQKELKKNELFWIVENGLKMTGMPAFGNTYTRDQIVETVAFIVRLPEITPDQYRLLATGSARLTEEDSCPTLTLRLLERVRPRHKNPMCVSEGPVLRIEFQNR